MDAANQYSKREFALEWNIVLGTPPRADARDRTREQTIDEYVKWLERVANAKDTLEEVEAATPVARKLIDRIRTETGLDVTDNEGRKRILKAIEIGRSLGRLATALKGTGVPQLGGPLAKLLSDPELFPGWEVLSPHLRKRLLVDGYHMEPERMIAYTRQFGPLDWRHASAHAIYWAQRGVDESQLRVGKLNAGDFDFLNTDRVVIQAVQDLYRSGTIYFDVVKPESYLAINNGNFIPTYREALVAMLDREAKQFEITRNNDMRNNPFNQYRAGYENFMRDAIAYTYRRGDKEGAGKLQIQLLADFKLNKLNWNDPSLEDQLQMPLDQFVVEQIKERITSPDVARSEVYAGLFGAFLSLLNDDTPLYQTQFQYAKDFHKAFFDEQYRQTNVDASKARMEVMPHDWTTCATLILMTGVMQALGVQEAAIIYGRLPEEEIRCMAYDEMAREMKQGLDAQAKAGRGPTFDQLFPPPPSLAEYRARKAAEQISAPRKSGAELK